MNYTYEEFKAGMLEMRKQQDMVSKNARINAVRYSLPLPGRDIEIAVYRESRSASVLFCFYGGGFSLGTYTQDDSLWTALHQQLHVTLVSIGYRKAPEHPFPAALQDAYESIAYIQEHRAEYGIESEDWSVYGNSAGGNLAAAVCLLDAQKGNCLHLRRQILNYPYLDLATSPQDKGHPEGEHMMYRMFSEYYCQNTEPNNVLVSPVFANEADLRSVPRAIITLADRDSLHAEGARYVCKLRAAGIQVDSMVAADMFHGYSETCFQEDNPYLDPMMRQQLKDGSMKEQAIRTIAYIRDHF